MERSDHLMRVIRTNYILSFDASAQSETTWDELVTLLSGATPEHLDNEGDPVVNALLFLISDPANPNSMRSLISKARENARGVQDNITKEVWEEVNQLYHIVIDPTLPDKIQGSGAMEIIDKLDQSSLLFYGVTDSTMPRGQGWNFMSLGKFIERTTLTIDTIHYHFKNIENPMHSTQDILFWKNLLLSLS